MPYIGLDLGGTDIKGGVVDADGSVLARHRVATESNGGPEHVMDRMDQLAREVADRAGLDWQRVDGIGVGTPGPIGPGGVVLQAPNLPGWTHVPLHAGLTERTRRPVAVVNDADAAAFGEYWVGTGRNTSVTHMILLTLGTGVGGGVVINGQLYAGAHHAGAELGHTIIHAGGRLCGCGQRGCVEQYTSATAIAADARQLRNDHPDSAIPPDPTCKDVYVAAAAGDTLAQRIVEDASVHLGIVCVNFVRAFDPQMIVLGGGVVAAGDAFIQRVRRAFDDHTWHVRPEQVHIAAASLGNNAGFLGAAGLAASKSK